MSNVVVFVFLLDNLAGFNNALNETLVRGAKYTQSHIPPTIQNCDPATTDQILSAVSQDLELDILSSFRAYDNQLSNDQSPENVYNALLDNSIHEVDNIREDESFEKQSEYFDNDFSSFYRRRTYDITDHPKVKKVNVEINGTKVEFPKNASFLVAIFETLSNITAQTCAGTLLSPQWVLTAANCINILSNLYSNSTNMTDSSQYTIVVGSTNPLHDGSAHNVTMVLLHPDVNSSRPVHKSMEMDGPYLALMRIVPEVEVPKIEIVQKEENSGDVMVYGWILSKNESDHETLNSTSMSAQILSSAECQAMYSYRNNDVICLISNDMDKNITQLSSGGPVLMVKEGRVKLLAVVQTDEHLFVAYPLAGHNSWINQVINNK